MSAKDKAKESDVDLLDASEHYLRGEMTAAAFDKVAKRRSEPYRAAMIALGEAETRSSLGRAIRSVVEGVARGGQRLLSNGQ